MAAVRHEWLFEELEPHRRSWPYPPTRLERLALELGVDDEDLRWWIRAELERRRAQAHPLLIARKSPGGPRRS